jgi:hypothetical protein
MWFLVTHAHHPGKVRQGLCLARGFALSIGRGSIGIMWGGVGVRRCSLKNLRRVAKDVGDYVGEEELVAMIDEFDKTGEGAIGLDDFLAIMHYASA